MSLINEKRHDVYDYKPSLINSIFNKLHKEFKDTERINQNNCPSCKNNQYKFAFDKYDFHYVQCQKCMSLYVQNRLSEKEVVKYEKKILSRLYLTQEYDIYLKNLINKISPELELIFSRLFNKKQKLNVAYLGYKSEVYQSVLKNFNINFIFVEKYIDLKSNSYDLIIIDHIIEKSTNINQFLNKVKSSLNDCGFVYLNVRVGSGIDILTLWEDSLIFPIEHSNLISLEGIKILFDSNKLSIKEIHTPGVLDIDNILKSSSNKIPRFLKYLKETNNQKAIEEFQTFIQKNLLSSFATILAQRK